MRCYTLAVVQYVIKLQLLVILQSVNRVKICQGIKIEEDEIAYSALTYCEEE